VNVYTVVKVGAAIAVAQRKRQLASSVAAAIEHAVAGAAGHHRPEKV
jgi:hypothetical protein